MLTGSLNPEAIRYDDNKILRELIQSSVARQVAQHRPILNYLTDSKYRYEKESIDTNPQVDKGFGTTRRADFELKYVDVEVTNIKEAVGYTRDQLAKINNSLLPMNDRTRTVIRKIAESEDRYFFAGDPKFANSGISDSNNHTAWGATAFDVSSFANARSTLGEGIGQLFDHYKDALSSKPIMLVVNHDVYKDMITASNANTDRSLIEVLTLEMKMHGANTALPSHVFPSKFLGATLDYDGMDVVLETEGSANACLLAFDPNYYEVVTSPLDQNPYQISGGGMEVEIGESYVPTWKKTDGIIYEDDVTLAA